MSKKENSAPRNFKMAYWHFPPSRREFVEGRWKLIKPKDKFVDKEDTEWSCLVQVNSLGNFIANECESKGSKADPKKRWAQGEEALPGWADIWKDTESDALPTHPPPSDSHSKESGR